jgi:uncharacterized protein (UPF0335 family)
MESAASKRGDAGTIATDAGKRGEERRFALSGAQLDSGRVRLTNKPENKMSEGNVSNDQLRLFMERIERLEEEKKGVADDIRDVYSEAKSQGYDTKIMRQIFKLRKMEPHDRAEMEALLDVYKSALGLG